MGVGLLHILLTPYPEWFLVRLRALLSPRCGPLTLEAHGRCVLSALYRGAVLFSGQRGRKGRLTEHVLQGRHDVRYLIYNISAEGFSDDKTEDQRIIHPQSLSVCVCMCVTYMST